MKVYISGPISNVDPRDSMMAFNAIETKLRAAGCTPINPRGISHWDLSWETYMKIAQDVLYSGEVDAVVLLKGWEDSDGACIEKVWAEANGIYLIYEGGK